MSIRWWRAPAVLVLTGAAACADGARPDETGATQLSADASRSDDPRSTTRSPTTIEVDIHGFEYRPAVLEVIPGDTVRWTNHDIVPHTVTGAEVGAAAVGATGPDGASGPDDATGPDDAAGP